MQNDHSASGGSGRDSSQLNNLKTSSNVTSNENQGIAISSGVGSKKSKKSMVHSLNRLGQLPSNNSGISDKSNPMYSIRMPPPSNLAPAGGNSLVMPTFQPQQNMNSKYPAFNKVKQDFSPVNSSNSRQFIGFYEDQ